MKGITGNFALEAYRRTAVAPVTSQAAQPSAETPTSPERAPTEAAKVSISSQARDLATNGPGGEVNSKKVESLKTAISDGSFKVNSNLVAERLVDTLG
jgi:flagellar biosynthesis anti-sigma factor FlgM